MKQSEFTDSVLLRVRFQLIHGSREMFVVIPQRIALLISWDGTNYVYMTVRAAIGEHACSSS